MPLSPRIPELTHTLTRGGQMRPRRHMDPHGLQSPEEVRPEEVRPGGQMRPRRHMDPHGLQSPEEDRPGGQMRPRRHINTNTEVPGYTCFPKTTQTGPHMKQLVNFKDYMTANWSKGMDMDEAIKRAVSHANQNKDILGFNFNLKTRKPLFLKRIDRSLWAQGPGDIEEKGYRIQWNSLYLKA
jgi:hypothetical protein